MICSASVALLLSALESRPEMARTPGRQGSGKAAPEPGMEQLGDGISMAG